MKKSLLIIITGLFILNMAGCGSTITKQVKATSLATAELTEVTPYLQREIVTGKNLIYCSTFQLAWNEMKNNVVKEDIHIMDEPLSVKYLNSSKVSKIDSSDKYYVD